MSSTSTQTVLSTRKKVRCLVIQLTRLGDTLQSLMALRAAKQLYPELEIHFVARERFAAAAKRVPWIENVITLPTDKLIGPVITGESSQTQAMGDIARWIAPLVRDTWDIVVNWSYSESSRLSHRLDACEVNSVTHEDAIPAFRYPTVGAITFKPSFRRKFRRIFI